MTRMTELPFDRIKIDRTFVDSIDDAEPGGALVKMIATLGKERCVPVSAEGVETEEVKRKLVELGCVDAQGWLFSEALSAKEAKLGFVRAPSHVGHASLQTGFGSEAANG